MKLATVALEALRDGSEPGILIDTLMELATIIRSSHDESTAVR